ncbi:MAG TPA: MmgE/PrpD family protein [Thermodesulfobacteriota bacterium]|nr:MmgE/PrpD family protein [Thermodesulfobacteriota bacterium]
MRDLMLITQELAKYCHSLKFRQLPEEVVDRVKYFFLDFIGVACRGSQEDSSRTMYRLVEELGDARQGGVIIGRRGRAPFVYAALANGTSAHAIEMDDVNNEASLHPGVVVFPAALATSEMVRGVGEKFIEAVVLGYEVMIRLGRALGPQNSYKRGFHPTGTCGSFGSSVVVSKIMGLKREEMISAMGIAGSQAAGSMEYLAQGAWTKRFHAGWAALSGMVAAQLARKGFKGPSSIIEGRDGFLHSYSDGADQSKVLEGIGTQYEILRTSIKPHACCRYMQPPIDAILKVVKENDLPPEKVEKVRVGILLAGARLIAEPLEEKYTPQSIVDAQFSMPFGAAVAILYRKAGLDEFQLSKIRSEEVKRMMRRVECVKDPDLEKTFPKQWCATAEIFTKDGKRYFTRVEYCKGDPENPLSWDELVAKFHNLSSGFWTRDRRSKIVETVKKLDEIQDLKKWSSLLLRNR